MQKNRRPAPATSPQPPAPQLRASVLVFPQKGTGRTSPLTSCKHCAGGPLIVRTCGPRTCAVCQSCGYHHNLEKLHA